MGYDVCIRYHNIRANSRAGRKRHRKIGIWLKTEEDRELVEIRLGMCERVNERNVIHCTVQISKEKLTKVKEFRVFECGGECSKRIQACGNGWTKVTVFIMDRHLLKSKARSTRQL